MIHCTQFYLKEYTFDGIEKGRDYEIIADFNYVWSIIEDSFSYWISCLSEEKRKSLNDIGESHNKTSFLFFIQ